MQLNPAAREVILKIVYYGPGMAGKTTNLEWIRTRATTGTASALRTLDVHSERTISFDLLALDLGQVQGNSVRLEFHTVPGQSYYAATRRQLLDGADGIVFVADSRREALDENIASMNEMLDNLRQLQQGTDQSIPVVIQYNKQDLPTALAREQLDPLMNVRAWPSFAAAAASGTGVDDSLHALTNLLLEAVGRVDLPQVAAAAAPKSWLISCHRCQAMLEVPQAAPGMIYSCGVCHSTLEVVDPDRGLTRDPAQASSPLPQVVQQRPQAPPPMPPRASDEHSDYAMKALPEAESTGSALQPAADAPRSEPGAFPLPGFEVLAVLDDSPQGRRSRVREMATGRICRALAVSPALMAQPGFADGLEPFVRLAGPLKHPHILPLLEMRPAGDQVVLLSADVPDHEPLSLVLSRRRALAPPHAMGLLRQVVLALEDAARQGVVHGWLRPECVLVNSDGQVLVDEFALPKSQRFLVRELAGASAATEYYLAPEHLGEDARHDLRSDMFLVGALLYRMITGEGLVTGYNAHEALHRLMATGGKPLRAVGNNVSRELDLFYKRLTALNRGERFEGYRQLVEVLDRFGGGAKRQTLRITQPISAPPGARPPSGARLAPGPAYASPRPRPSSANLGSGTGGHRRTATDSRSGPGPQRKSGGGHGWVIAVVVLCVLAIAGVAAYAVNAQQRNKPTLPERSPTPEQRQSPLVTSQPTAPAPRPATTTLAPVTIATPPVSERRPEDLAVDRRKLMDDIGDLVLAERWMSARIAAERIDVPETRQAKLQQIQEGYEKRRHAIEELARAATSLAQLETALAPARNGTWGMPDDAVWAQALLDETKGRLDAQGPTTPAIVPQDPTPPAVQTAPPAPAPTPAIEDPVGQIAAQVFTAIATGAPQQAQNALRDLPAEGNDGRVLRLLVQHAPRLTQVIDRVAKARSTALRLTHPTTNELCDITAAAPSGIELASTTGMTSSLSWGQVGVAETCRLAFDAAAAPNLAPEDHTAVVAVLLAHGDDVHARGHLRRSRNQLAPELLADLATAATLAQRGTCARLLQQAEAALRAANAKVLGDTIADLRKLDRSAVPQVAQALPRLEQALKDIADGRVIPGGVARDEVGFDTPDDLRQFPDQTGAWEVSGGTAQNTSDNARLARRDAGTSRAAEFVIMPQAARGSITLEFKGLRLSFDLASGTVAPALVGGNPPPALRAALVERFPNVVLLEYQDDGNRMIVDVNGQVVMRPVMGDLQDILAISTSGNARVQIDKVKLMRASTASPGKARIRSVGWEAAGNAAMDDSGAITLTSAPAEAASLSRQITPMPGRVGLGFAAKGKGALKVQLLHGRAWAEIEVPLGANPVALNVRWAEGKLDVSTADGTVLASKALAGAPATLALTATQQAVIIPPFTNIRQ